MFKLTIDEDHGRERTLRLEGRLAAAWVDEFAAALNETMSGGIPVTLDLDGLTFADDRGVAIIRSGIVRGARVSGGSQFIAALIADGGAR